MGSSQNIQGLEKSASTDFASLLWLPAFQRLPQFPPSGGLNPQPLTPQPRKTKASRLSHLPGREGWDEPSEEKPEKYGCYPVRFPFFLRSDILQLLATLYRFPLPSNSFLFFAFLSGVSPNKLLFLSVSASLSLSLSPTAPKPSLLPSHCSYLSLLAGEPGPKGDPGEKSHWVSSSTDPPAALPWTLRRLYRAAHPNPAAPGLPGESLPCQVSAPAHLSTLSLPSGQGQPYKQTYTLCLRHCLCLLSAVPLQARVTPAASSWVVWADPVQTACPAPIALPSKGSAGFCSPVSKKGKQENNIHTEEGATPGPLALGKPREAQAGRCRNTEVHRSPLQKGWGTGHHRKWWYKWYTSEMVNHRQGGLKTHHGPSVHGE